MRVYVAAKFEEAERARTVMAALRRQGFAVTHDWTNEDENRVEPGDAREAYFRGCAQADVDGVRTADVVVLLWHPALQGGLVEIGAALALGIPVVLVDAPRDARCIFFRLCVRASLADVCERMRHVVDIRERTREGAAFDMLEEVRRARAKWPPFNSAHEGYATLLEEVDELKAHVWMNQAKRDVDAMRKEAVQVGAMAIRFVEDIVDGGKVRR